MLDITKLFSSNACDIRGTKSTQKRTRREFYTQRKTLRADGIEVVLVDMIDHPVVGSIPISNDIRTSGSYPDGTYFVLYCHSGGSSGYVQMQLTPHYPQYHFINMTGGIGAYHDE